jgi:sugar-specific transcriptional regulator TrmB
MKQLVLPMLRPDDEPVLAGRLSGKRAFVAALEQLPEMVEPSLVLLDFGRVDLATSSFLSEVVLPLRDHLRLRHPPGYAVAANLSDTVREEIEEMLRRSGDALLICTTDAAGRIGDVQLCGKLEDRLQETLSLVSRKRETTAAQLHEESREVDAVGATAWNNRLASLAAKSLVVEILQGRTKRYRPVLEVA